MSELSLCLTRRTSHGARALMVEQMVGREVSASAGAAEIQAADWVRASKQS